jgi:plasmid stabilization system protein ParE
MSRTVIISKLAERKLNKLFEYLIAKWSIKVKNEFIKKLDKSISLIKEQPESFLSSEKEKGLRKCVITKQTTLYYRFDKNKIKVVTLFDTRQNPTELKAK